MAQGQLYTFGDTVTTKRTISNVVRIIDPQDIKAISYFGTNNQGKFRLQNFPNHKVEWLEDTLRVRTTTMNNGGVLTAGGGTVVVTDATLFKAGDVILIEAEKIWVSSVNTGNNTLTLGVRGWGGTTAAQHADGLPVTYLFSARLEGSDSNASYFTVPTNPFNYSQIFHWEIMVSGSEQDASSRYGIADSYKYQLMKAMGGLGAGNGRQGRAGDLMIDLEKTFFYGGRVQRTSSVAGGMGGFETYVTTNVTDLAAAPLQEKDFLNSIESCWAKGGMPDTAVVGSFNKRLITSWYRDSVRTTRNESTGGVVIDSVDTEYGTINLMLNRWQRSDRVYVCQRDLLGWVTLRDWFVQPLAVSGDYRKDEVIGEFSFVLANEKAHAVIKNTAIA